MTINDILDRVDKHSLAGCLELENIDAEEIDDGELRALWERAQSSFHDLTVSLWQMQLQRTYGI